MAYTTRHSGRRIRALFDRLGYDPYYTNAVKCFPEAADGTNREPTADERVNCRSHLERELAQVAPSVVVATGKHATATMLAFEDRTMDGFVDRVLVPDPLPSVGCVLLPLFHPSYQDVWVARAGYDDGAYEARIRERLTELVDESL
jgi:uracil-DNA glycosylase family 4